MEQKRESNSGRTTFDIKPMEKLLKRYETSVTKDFVPSERTKRSDAREQIIEEQIEEYKRKREKILGGHSSISFVLNDARKESQEVEQNVSGDNASSKSNSEQIQVGQTRIYKEGNDHIDIVSEQMDQEKIVNTEEYLTRLTKLKVKWEEAKKKKESLQKELDDSYIEGNLEKLARILGEKEKNLQVMVK